MQTIRNPSNIRHVLLCSILSEQNIIVQSINNNSNPPGLKTEESQFLKLIENISNGTKIIVTKGGTLMKFYCGLITNNQGVQFEFDCGLNRCISYYLQYLLLIAIFGKTSLNIHLKGLTNTSKDSSVDSIQNHLIPLLKEHYEFDNELHMKIVKRGYLPEGGGEVHITIPAIRKLKKVNLEEKGYIKRVRGVAAGSKLSTSILNEMSNKVKGRLLEYLPDVWIHTDFYKGNNASLSSGYSLFLKAETTTGGIITFDSAFQQGTTQQFALKTLDCFLDEMEHSGYISTNYQWFALTLMSLSEKKTSSIKVGRISQFSVECLRVIRDFFGVIFEIQESQSQNLALFRCLGIGYQNLARVVK